MSTGGGSIIPVGSRGREFMHYASMFETVELNVTFYRMPSEAACLGPDVACYRWPTSEPRHVPLISLRPTAARARAGRL